jgi:GT2 family glycosyltransferase
MKVSVLVLYYREDSLDDTINCVQYLKLSNYKNIDLICINNGLKHSFESSLRKVWPNLKHINLKLNTGFTGGNIEALQHATGDIICLLNNDAIIHPESISNAVRVLESDEKIAAAGGQIYTLSENHPSLRESNPFHTYQKVNPFSGDAVTLKFNPKVADVDSVSGSLIFIKKSVIDKIGFLDNRFFAYYEETDFCTRAILAGYKIKFSDSIKLWHRNGSLNPDPKRQRLFYFQLFKNQFLFASNNFSKDAFKTYLNNYRSRVANRGSIKAALKHPFSPERYFYQSVKSILFNFPSILKLRSKKELGSKPKLEDVLLNNVQDLSLVIDSDQPIKTILKDVVRFKLKVQEVLLIARKPLARAELEAAKLNQEKGYEFIRFVESKLFNTHHKAVIEASSNNVCYAAEVPESLNQLILSHQKNAKLKFVADDSEKPSLILGSKLNWLEYFSTRETKTIAKHLQDITSSQVDITESKCSKELNFNNRKMKLKPKPSDYPIFINCRDRLDPLKELLLWLNEEDCPNIILIDNNSSNPKLLELYKQSDYETINLNANDGHISLWNRNVIDLIAKEQRFIYTDPDIVPNPGSHGALIKFNQLLDKYPDVNKVGFGLSLDEIPDTYHLKQDVIKWEKKFWEDEVEPEVFRAPIDTTFALYRASTPYLHEPALRTGGKFTAKHEPWYTNSNNPSDDLLYYLERADRASNSWGASKKDGVAHHQKANKH